MILFISEARVNMFSCPETHFLVRSSHKYRMRYIDLLESLILNENGIVNANWGITFKTGPGSLNSRYLGLENVSEAFGQLDVSPDVRKWLQTVLLNWMKRRVSEGDFEALEQLRAPNREPLIEPVEQFLHKLADYHSEETDPKALIAQLPEWARGGYTIFPFSAEDWFYDSAKELFTDYLVYRVATGQSIERLSVPDALRLSREWHNHKNTKGESNDVDGQDIEALMTFPDGYRVVRILTDKALRRESALCAHCVGKGGYYAYLDTPGKMIASLRDPKNMPLATLEISDNLVHQAKGRDNGPIEEKARPYVLQFLKRAGLRLVTDHDKLGLSKDRDY